MCNSFAVKERLDQCFSVPALINRYLKSLIWTYGESGGERLDKTKIELGMGQRVSH